MLLFNINIRVRTARAVLLFYIDIVLEEEGLCCCFTCVRRGRAVFLSIVTCKGDGALENVAELLMNIACLFFCFVFCTC